jgi:ribosomal protein S18 acetylase RimI-like enzyme
VIEIDHNNSATLIRSLVVDPFFFRQGIAKKLMEFVLDTFDSNLFVVETGLENGPATALYEKFGFIEVEQWDTNHGVRKIKFEKRINN